MVITIDGGEGEGGGQVVRTACALSLVTGQPFRIVNVRGGREKPGLMRQHVTAVEAACAIGGAECEGLRVGSAEIGFRPGRTVLPPLMLADAPSRLVLEGGTHNIYAPPFDFLARSFLPVVNRMGPRIEARLLRHGFFPRGGGRIEVDIHPAPLTPVECVERGALGRRSATAVFAGLPLDIADREIKAAREVLDDWPEEAFGTRELPADQGPGTILLLEAAFEHVTEVVSGFGKLGVAAEALARTAANRMAGYLQSDAFAGPYLQDQLLLPFALAGGGAFTTVKPSGHSLTGREVIERFLGRRCVFRQRESGAHLVTVG